MLIRDAEIGFGARRLDLRVEGARIVEMAAGLRPKPQELVIDARGDALLPGLHDHHLHLYATAAAMQSLDCGPPSVEDRAQLARVIATACARAHAPGEDWIRGTGYHESVAGLLDRTMLDAWAPLRPLRVQHRSGRLWVFNSRGLERLVAPEDDGANDPLERVDGRLTGRLYDADAWLRSRIGTARPDLRALSQRLARVGVSGSTDTSHANDRAVFAALADCVSNGEVAQHLLVMGDGSLDVLDAGPADALVVRGAHKFHLHDHALPDFDEVCAAVRGSHAAGRAVAFHCVTRGELVFAMAVLGEAGCEGRDRIEHAGLVAPDLLAELRRLRVRVVTQPHFISERGDDYLRDVATAEHADLYRLRSFIDMQVPLAAGSDAPYGGLDPWRSMAAAVTRSTRSGQCIGHGEALSPEQALGLFLAPLDDPGGASRRLDIGASADLCLLDRPWSAAREALHEVSPRTTLIRGQVAWNVGGFL